MMNLDGVTREHLEALDDGLLRMAFAITQGWRFWISSPAVPTERNPFRERGRIPVRFCAEKKTDFGRHIMEDWPFEELVRRLPELPERDEAIGHILSWASGQGR